MSHLIRLPHQSLSSSAARKRPFFLAPQAWPTPLSASARRTPLAHPSLLGHPAPHAGAQENTLSSLGQLLLGFAIGGVVYHLLDDLLSSPRRPHLEAWKREYVFDRDGGQCTYCGVRVTWASHHIDHKTALACGGNNEVRNLTLSCKPCNLSKGTLNAREFKRYLNYIDQKT